MCHFVSFLRAVGGPYQWQRNFSSKKTLSFHRKQVFAAFEKGVEQTVVQA